MNDRRFLHILNEVAESFAGIWDAGVGRQDDASSLQAWAGFLSACVERGVSISDERWRELEVRVRGGRPRFTLPAAGNRGTAHESDFSVGLALLIGLLDRDPKSG